MLNCDELCIKFYPKNSTYLTRNGKCKFKFLWFQFQFPHSYQLSSLFCFWQSIKDRSDFLFNLFVIQLQQWMATALFSPIRINVESYSLLFRQMIMCFMPAFTVSHTDRQVVFCHSGKLISVLTLGPCSLLYSLGWW